MRLGVFWRTLFLRYLGTYWLLGYFRELFKDLVEFLFIKWRFIWWSFRWRSFFWNNNQVNFPHFFFFQILISGFKLLNHPFITNLNRPKNPIIIILPTNLKNPFPKRPLTTGLNKPIPLRKGHFIKILWNRIQTSLNIFKFLSLIILWMTLWWK